MYKTFCFVKAFINEEFQFQHRKASEGSWCTAIFHEICLNLSAVCFQSIKSSFLTNELVFLANISCRKERFDSRSVFGSRLMLLIYIQNVVNAISDWLKYNLRQENTLYHSSTVHFTDMIYPDKTRSIIPVGKSQRLWQEIA